MANKKPPRSQRIFDKAKPKRDPIRRKKGVRREYGNVGTNKNKKGSSKKQLNQIQRQLNTVKKQRNSAIKYIFVISLLIIFVAIYLGKDVTLYFHSDLDDLDQYERIELVTMYNGVEHTYTLSEARQKVPKTSELLYLRVYDDVTIENPTPYTVSYDVNETLSFQSNQTIDNIEFEEGDNFKNESSEWWVGGIGNNLHKQKILDFSFNRSYQAVKNMTISFEFKTNYTSGDLLNDFDVEFYNFQREIFIIDIYDEDDLTAGELTVINASIEFPCVYLNRTYETNTTFRVLFHAREKLTGGEENYDFNISNVEVAGYFWKDIDQILISDIVELDINTSVLISNTVEIYENKIIVGTIVNITHIYQFGSFTETEVHTFNNTVIVEEKIHTFPLDNRNLLFESLFGTLELDIDVTQIDLDTHTLDRSITYPRISTF